MAEQLVPVRTSEGPALTAEFGVHGLVPHCAVPDVVEELDGVVAGVAEDVQGGLHCYGGLGFAVSEERSVEGLPYTLFPCAESRGLAPA